jgi:hypothetical protein
MVRKPPDKKPAAKVERKRPEDTTVSIPLDFESAVRAFLGTPPPPREKKPKK